MPCEYEIDLERRLVRCYAWGVLTHSEATALRERFSSDPAFNPHLFQMYDFREVTALSMTADQIRELASHSPFAPGARRAAIAPQHAVYGAARMFATEHEASVGESDIRIFRSLKEAEAWLGLESRQPMHYPAFPRKTLNGESC